MEKKLNPLDTVIDFRGFLYKILNNWFYFFLSIILASVVAFAYARYAHEYYKSSTKVYIQSENESSSASDILYNNLSVRDNGSLIDERQLFLSYPLVFQTVSDLRFDVSYYIVGDIKTSESFIAPIKIICDLETTQNNPITSFEISVIDETSYQLFNDRLNYEEELSFGDEVQLKGYNFVVERDTNYKSESFPNTIVNFNNFKKIAKQYQSKIQINQIEADSDILEISILEEDQLKGVNFLNTLVKNYINNDSVNKLLSSINTVDFIHKEIELIKDSLLIIEIKLQDYKNTHQIPDINLKTQNIYEKISQLETELSTYKYQDKYYSYLEDYINKGDGLSRVIAPSTYGINNSTLSIPPIILYTFVNPNFSILLGIDSRIKTNISRSHFFFKLIF